MKKNTEADFWKRVSVTDGCWLWTGSTNYSYGHCNFMGKRYKTHRLSWIITYGDIPGGLFVCHSCDNPLCVRPDHLFLGTRGDNMRDMVEKGRGTRGRNIKTNRKLYPQDVLDIRSRYKKGATLKEISSCYGICKSTALRIKKNKIWNHLGEPRFGPAPKASKILTFNGKKASFSQWGKELGIKYATLNTRKKLGWSTVNILNTPVRSFRWRQPPPDAPGLDSRPQEPKK